MVLVLAPAVGSRLSPAVSWGPKALAQTAVRMKLAGAKPPSHWETQEKQPGISNYFLGNDPAKWRANIPHYGRVTAPPGLPRHRSICYGNGGQFEYDFALEPKKPIRAGSSCSGRSGCAPPDHGRRIRNQDSALSIPQRVPDHPSLPRPRMGAQSPRFPPPTTARTPSAHPSSSPPARPPAAMVICRIHRRPHRQPIRQTSSSRWQGSVTATFAPLALRSVTSHHTGTFMQGQMGATYTVTVSNASGAPATTGPVTVTEDPSRPD